MAAGMAARLLPLVVGLGLLPWTSHANPLFEDLEFQIIDSNGSAQLVIDQFLPAWGKQANLRLRNDAFHGRPSSGFSLFRRACPLPSGGDCEPVGPANNLCCEDANPAFCCGDNFPTCCTDYCCGADAICCKGPGIGCCWDTQQCCGTNERDGFCCEKDQECGTDGTCIDPKTTITRTTTLTETRSGKATVTQTEWNIIERGSTEYETETTTISDAKTATVLITRTVTVTDDGETTSISVAKRNLLPTPTATGVTELSGSEDDLKRSEAQPGSNVIYLRMEPSLDPVADFLRARDFEVERRDTVTYTVWITSTTTVGATETVTSTDKRTSYVTSVDTEMITETSYVGAEETVTSTTTFTTHVLAGQSNSGNGNSNGDGSSSSSSSNNAAIIGGSVGGAIGGLLVLLVIFLLWKRHSDKKKLAAAQNPAYNPMMYGPPHQQMHPGHWGGAGYVPTSQSPPGHQTYVPPQEMAAAPYSPQPVYEADGSSPPVQAGAENKPETSPPPRYQ